MPLVHRVLAPHPITSLDEYLTRRGGGGLENARKVEPEAIIDEIEAAGLRGRGGAGFPTHRKWRTTVENRSSFERATIVINAAEGEPGTFKDRTIIRNDPYQVIEGALIAARAVAADQVIFGLKRSFVLEVTRMREAIAEVTAAGWCDGVGIFVFEGPNEYLYGEETAMLEAIDGRYPFPRIAPPFRRGVQEIVEDESDLTSRSNMSAHVEMAGPNSDQAAPPALVENVETLANVARIIARGGSWFRTEGTEQSPGTLVVTITGSTARHGVGEVMMGTTLREAIEMIGGGARGDAPIKAVMSGVSNALLPASALDTPLTYEDMAAAGGGLGSGGYIVFDERDDLVAVAAGASRFLAVESCGQCQPCKVDGLTISDVLDKLCRNEASATEMAALRRRVGTVADGARCFLASQQQAVVGSVLGTFAAEVEAHVAGTAAPVQPYLIAELEQIEGFEAVWDERHRDKQPDWSYGEYSGQTPADRYDEHRAPQTLES